jgi:methionyl-tRNA synthetase
LCEGFQFHAALDRTLTFIKAINRYIEQRAPWKLAKSAEANDQALLRTSLATMTEALRLGATLLAPVMPSTTAKVQAALGHTPGPKWTDELQWGATLTGAKLQPGLVLFPRPEKPAV